MMLPGAPRLSKISREVSNYIVTLVLERAEDLIRNSYRRLTTENVARNEHWANIADIVSEQFEMNAETERIKSHFHNRKKVLLARMKEEFKTMHDISSMSIDDKIRELVYRRICCGEHDEQLARVCLEVEEEEKNRADMEGVSVINPIYFNEQPHHSHQSLLSQLLNNKLDSSSNNSITPSQDEVPSPTPTQLVEFEPKAQANRAPLLSKLLSDVAPSTSNMTVHPPSASSSSTSNAQNPIPVHHQSPHPHQAANDRKRRAPSVEKRLPIFTIPPPSYNGISRIDGYLSHLIVDVTSPNELKKLLSVLIDHGFCRFQHVDSLRSIQSSNSTAPHRRPEVNSNGLISNFDSSRPASSWKLPPANSSPNNEDSNSLDVDVVKDIQSRVERVDVEVKMEPELENDDEFGLAFPRSQENESEGVESNEEEDIDSGLEYQLEMEMIKDANKKGLALFERNLEDQPALSPTAKKAKLNGDSSMIPCQLCGTVIRLNTGGSKWNLYEHVMLKHSNSKAYKCTMCNYEAARRIRVRQHARTQHNAHVEPVDLTTPEIRKEWLISMSKCFPQHQYTKSTIASKIYSPPLEK